MPMRAVLRRKPLPRPAPDGDPRFRRVMEQVKTGAARSKAHHPAAKKAQQAAAAAQGPAHEKLATGKAKQVSKIQEAPTKKPEPQSFLELLRSEIQAAMPKTLADTNDFMKGNKPEEMKGSLKGNVSQQKEAASGGVKSASKEPPKETGPGKEVTPLAPDAPPAAPAVNGPDGMPAPKSDADVSLQDSKQDVDQQMKDNQVTPRQCEKANDPRFSAVLGARDAVGKQADAGPGQYRAAEEGVAANAAAAAKGAAVKGAIAMVGVRGRSNSAVLTRQQVAKQKEEQARKAVTDHIEEIYSNTKERVEAKLASLDDEVGKIFDAGVESALQNMTDYVEARIEEYKDDRYSGILGKGRWLRDKFKGLPDEANVFYERGRVVFTQMMDRVVVRVADLVERRLKEAKDEVAKGQAEIQKYVDGQPKELKNVAMAAQKDVSGRFEELQQSIDDKKNQLAQQLAQKYKEAFDKANEALDKIRAANAGLIAAFLDKLIAIIKILLDFKDKLLSMLKKAASVIGDIISDPIGFLSNLIDAIKQGVSQFVSNIWAHLKRGFMKWLFGSLEGLGIEIPSDFSLVSILKLVLAVLGITYDRMRAKAVKLIGPGAVAFIEKVAEYIKTLITGGPAKLWELIQEDLSNLKEMVLDAIMNWVIETVIKQATIKMLSMFNPAGAIIQAILMIYHVIVFIIEKAAQLLDLVNAVIDSVAAIVAGSLGAAANKIETALANMIPLLIGFLAELIGLGGISKKVRDFIERVRNAVDKAIDKGIAKVIGIVKKIGGLFTGKKAEKPGAGPSAEPVAADPAAVKAKVRQDLGPKLAGVETADQLQPLLNSTYAKYQPEGLKRLDVKREGHKAAVFQVFAHASDGEPVGEVVAHRTLELSDLDIKRPMTVLLYAINGVDKGRIENSEDEEETGRKDHAEVIMMDRICGEWQAITKANPNPPHVLEVHITRSPCGACAGKLLKFIAARNIKLKLRILSIYEGKKGGGKGAARKGLKALIMNANVEVERWDAWAYQELKKHGLEGEVAPNLKNYLAEKLAKVMFTLDDLKKAKAGK
jgi:Novel AID APOBEC clade 1